MVSDTIITEAHAHTDNISFMVRPKIILLIEIRLSLEFGQARKKNV